MKTRSAYLPKVRWSLFSRKNAPPAFGDSSSSTVSGFRACHPSQAK
jgi:hypothetical protein